MSLKSTCEVCHEPVQNSTAGKHPFTWVHAATDDPTCHTGDGATALPADYWALCTCGHHRHGHFDETTVCERCPCERYVNSAWVAHRSTAAERGNVLGPVPTEGHGA